MSTIPAEPITGAAEHEIAGRSLNWWGMIFFIASEALIFANLIAAYLYLEIRGNGTAMPWRLPNGEHLDFAYPLINTFILLASSIPVRIAGAGIVKNNRRNLILGLLGTIILGSIFLGGQIYEYTSLFGQHFNPQYRRHLPARCPDPFLAGGLHRQKPLRCPSWRNVLALRRLRLDRCLHYCVPVASPHRRLNIQL